jgi:chromosome segregation ATPase
VKKLQKDHEIAIKTLEEKFVKDLLEKDKLLEEGRNELNELYDRIKELELNLTRAQYDREERDKKITALENDINTYKAEMIKTKANYENLTIKLETEYKEKQVNGRLIYRKN